MSPEETAAFYAADYRVLQQGTQEPVEKDLLAQEARALVTVEWMASRLTSVTRHLDLGSSSGALLEAVRGRFGCSGVGIEPGEAYRRYSQGRGLEVVPRIEELGDTRQAPFDLVTAMHVLEHLPEPVASLGAIRTDHMRAGGALLVEVPNLADHEAFELAHLHAFTPTSLMDTVRRAGFDVRWIRTHGGYRSPVLRLYITLLARAGHAPRDRRYWPLAALRSRLMRKIGATKRRFFTRHYPDWTWQSPEKVLSAGKD